MTDTIDLVSLNTDWLNAWTAQDVSKLLTYYHPDVFYRDSGVPNGVRGHTALRARLEEIFANGSQTTFEPRRVWETDDGYFGVWIGHARQADGTTRLMRGLDYCRMHEGQIIHNDVYVHQIDGTADSLPF